MTLNTSYKTCMPASANQNHGGMRSAYIGCSHGCQLGIGVVCRCHLDDIGGDDVQAIEPPQNRPQLARGPTARLRCACCRRERRVNGVDLDKRSRESIALRQGAVATVRTSMERYTGLSPTVSRIFFMIPSVPIRGPKERLMSGRVRQTWQNEDVPMVSISRASMRWKPDASSFA